MCLTILWDWRIKGYDSCGESGLGFFNDRNEAQALRNVEMLIENQFESSKKALLKTFVVIMKEFKLMLKKKEITLHSMRFF